MGCGSSASRDVQLSSHHHVEKITKQVRIERGTNAKLRLDDDNIVFVFGGPGSGKGKLISKLLEDQKERAITTEVISTELLILDQLPHKVSNAIKLQSTKDVTDLLQSDPSHVTLQWILSLVEQYIRHHDNTENIVYLVDLIPNLQCMVANSNIGEDCCNHLGQFEAKLPVAFALNFAVHEDDLSTSQHNGLLPQGATIGDEADNSRTKQRLLSYLKLVTPFLQYFKDNCCLVTVDVSSGESPTIQEAVNKIFRSVDSTLPWKPSNAVLVFALNGMTAGNLELSQITMATVVALAPLVTTANSLEDELTILMDQICCVHDAVEYIIINAKGTKLANQNANQLEFAKLYATKLIAMQFYQTKLSSSTFSKQAVMFRDITATGHSTPCQKLNDAAMTTYFKSFHSNGKTLLFPVATSDHFCEIISCYLSNN